MRGWLEEQVAIALYRTAPHIQESGIAPCHLSAQVMDGGNPNVSVLLGVREVPGAARGGHRHAQVGQLVLEELVLVLVLMLVLVVLLVEPINKIITSFDKFCPRITIRMRPLTSAPANRSKTRSWSTTVRPGSIRSLATCPRCASK